MTHETLTHSAAMILSYGANLGYLRTTWWDYAIIVLAYGPSIALNAAICLIAILIVLQAFQRRRIS
jgi:hypothetical protein